jgi:hypothetical protein
MYAHSLPCVFQQLLRQLQLQRLDELDREKGSGKMAFYVKTEPDKREMATTRNKSDEARSNGR